MTNFDESPVVRASEIGQYEYCSVAWFLQREGHNPDSPSLERGKKGHAEMGRRVSEVQRTRRISRAVAYVGFLFLILGLVALALGWLL